MSELVSNFVSSIKNGIIPLIVSFTNTSSGPFTRVQWDFGDGSPVSTEINPTHVFARSGTFTVTLKVIDISGTETSKTETIVAYQDANIGQTGVTKQQALYTAKRFAPGEVNLIRRTTSGSTFETKYPLTNFVTLPAGTAYTLTVRTDFLSSTTQTTIDYLDTTNLFDKYINNNGLSTPVDGYVLLSLLSSGNTGAPPWTGWNSYYSGNAKLFPQTITYKIKSITATAGSGTLNVDRPTPVVGAVSGKFALANVFITNSGSTLSANTFWTNNNQALRSKQAIDSFDYLEATGTTGFATNGKGAIQYYGYDRASGQTITMMYPYYSGYDSVEAFYPGTIRLHLPTVMWHNSTTPGLTLYDVYGTTERDTETETRFKYLRDGVASTSNIVGKVFYDKKMLILDDVEVNAALQFNSNRSYTLPAPKVVAKYDTGGDTSTSMTYYVTYRVSDDGTAQTGNTSFGMGHLKPLHCRYIQQIIPGNATTRFWISAANSPWYAASSLYGTGFTVGNIDVIVGTGSTTSTGATPGSYVYSSMSISYPSMITGVEVPLYSAMTTAGNWYTFANEVISGNSTLSFGKEILGIGYLSGYLESTIYKMAATCVGRNNEFNSTQNSTFDSSTNEKTYVSEVALYNENDDLLMVCKLNKPIEKDDQTFVSVKLELDL